MFTLETMADKMNSDFFDLADRGLGALEEGLEAVGKYAEMFVASEKGSGLGLSKLLHGVNFHWKEIEKDEGDTFKDWSTRSTGLAIATIQRRICTWEFITEYIPPEHKDAFMNNWTVGMFSRGYRVAVKHTPNKHVGNYNYLPSGNEIEPADWLALSECIDDSMLIEALDKVTGKEPNANRIAFSLTDDGDLVFYRGKKHYTVIGTLSVGSHSDLVLEGIQELLDCLKNANKLKEEK